MIILENKLKDRLNPMYLEERLMTLSPEQGPQKVQVAELYPSKILVGLMKAVEVVLIPWEVPIISDRVSLSFSQKNESYRIYTGNSWPIVFFENPALMNELNSVLIATYRPFLLEKELRMRNPRYVYYKFPEERQIYLFNTQDDGNTQAKAD